MRIVPDGQQLSGRVPGPLWHGTDSRCSQAHGLEHRPAVSLQGDQRSSLTPSLATVRPQSRLTVAILRLAGVVTGRCVVWVDRRSRDLSWVPRRSDEPGR